MKKITMLVAGLIAIAVGTTQAQIKNDRGTFTKPGAGEMTFESQMSINVAGGSIFSLNDLFLQNLSMGIDHSAVNHGDSTFKDVHPMLPMVRVRKFKDATTAYRGLVNLSIANNTVKTAATAADSANGIPATKATSYKNGEFGIAIGVGIEKHHEGAERLSTYCGADVTIGYDKYHATVDNGTTTYKSSQGGFGFGLRAFTGFDYYFIPKVYLGLELGYGFGINSYGVQKNSGGTATDDKTKNSNLTFTPYITPNFRLGYRL